MTIRAWRIVKAKYAASAFSGYGAKIAGGRWNSPGHSVVYTAGAQSLAILEMLVHLQSHELLTRYVLFQVDFDRSLVETLPTSKLPRDWKRSPVPTAVQAIGDRWIHRGKAPVLSVPSVIVPSECNYLLNPLHPAFAKITIAPRQPIHFDPRLRRN